MSGPSRDFLVTHRAQQGVLGSRPPLASGFENGALDSQSTAPAAHAAQRAPETTGDLDVLERPEQSVFLRRPAIGTHGWRMSDPELVSPSCNGRRLTPNARADCSIAGGAE